MNFNHANPLKNLSNLIFHFNEIKVFIKFHHCYTVAFCIGILLLLLTKGVRSKHSTGYRISVFSFPSFSARWKSEILLSRKAAEQYQQNKFIFKQNTINIQINFQINSHPLFLIGIESQETMWRISILTLLISLVKGHSCGACSK